VGAAVLKGLCSLDLAMGLDPYRYGRRCVWGIASSSSWVTGKAKWRRSIPAGVDLCVPLAGQRHGAADADFGGLAPELHFAGLQHHLLPRYVTEGLRVFGASVPGDLSGVL
jgi:hypothetical protein